MIMILMMNILRCCRVSIFNERRDVVIFGEVLVTGFTRVDVFVVKTPLEYLIGK